MALREVTVQVPEASSALLDTVVEIVKDSTAKEWGQVGEDLFQGIKAYSTLSSIKEELKQPEIAVALGLALGQIAIVFLPKASAALKARRSSKLVGDESAKPAAVVDENAAKVEVLPVEG